MKRSLVNASMAWAEALLADNNIRLPDMAYWSPDEWRRRRDRLETVMRLELGWDVSDFNQGDFTKAGAVLYTVRNGLVDDPGVGVPYCEKYLLMKEGQYIPNHYHVFKTEDIICRAGGDLGVRLWNIDPASGERLDTDVRVFMDGIAHTFKAGEEIAVSKGNSITLTPYIAHILGARAGSGACIAGEVSKVNNDYADNFFLDGTGRFSEIDEDEPALHPLCNEYANL